MNTVSNGCWSPGSGIGGRGWTPGSVAGLLLARKAGRSLRSGEETGPLPEG